LLPHETLPESTLMALENSKVDPDDAIDRRVSDVSKPRLFDLFLYPRRYFSNTHALEQYEPLVPALLMGLAGAMDRIDKQLVKAELGRANKEWETAASWVSGSWWNYWLAAMLAGLVWALFLWYFGGWWYKKRLQWSGAIEPSSTLARRVNAMQTLVIAGPTILLALIQTVVYENYIEAWRADEVWSSAILLFLFLSCWTSYVAATTAFVVKKFRARLWFLVLPILLYVTVIGLIGAAYAFFA
jgi:hypothetical protein